MGCQSFISSFDLFGESNYLRYQKKDTFKTACGGLLSLLLILIFIAIILWKLFLVFFESPEQININEYKSYKKAPESFQLNKDNFMFAIQIDTPNFITNPYYQIRLNVKEINNGVKSTSQIQLAPCNVADFPNLVDEYNSLSLQNFLCPVSDFSVDLKGTYGNNIYRYINLEVVDCTTFSNINSGWSMACKSNADLTTYLTTSSYFSVNFYHINYEITRNWQHPSKEFIQSFTNFKFSPTYYKKIEIFLQKFMIQVDSSLYPVLEMLIGQNQTYIPVTQSSEIIQDSWHQLATQTAATAVYSDIYVRLSNFEMTYRMGFERADVFLAYIGGLVLFVWCVLKWILGSYHQNRFLLELAQKHYLTVLAEHKFDEDKVGNIQSPNLKKEVHPLPSQKEGDNSFVSRYKQWKINIEKKKINVTITLKYIFQKMFCCKGCYSEDVKLLDQIKKQIATDLDIVDLLDKIQQINLIKKLIFTPEQQNVINLIKRNKLTQHENLEILTDEQKTEQEINSLLSLLKKANYCETQVNEKMINCSEQDLYIILTNERVKSSSQRMFINPKETSQLELQDQTDNEGYQTVDNDQPTEKYNKTNSKQLRNQSQQSQFNQKNKDKKRINQPVPTINPKDSRQYDNRNQVQTQNEEDSSGMDTSQHLYPQQQQQQYYQQQPRQSNLQQAPYETKNAILEERRYREQQQMLHEEKMRRSVEREQMYYTDSPQNNNQRQVPDRIQANNIYQTQSPGIKKFKKTKNDYPIDGSSDFDHLNDSHQKLVQKYSPRGEEFSPKSQNQQYYKQQTTDNGFYTDHDRSRENNFQKRNTTFNSTGYNSNQFKSQPRKSQIQVDSSKKINKSVEKHDDQIFERRYDKSIYGNAPGQRDSQIERPLVVMDRSPKMEPRYSVINPRKVSNDQNY